MIISRMILMFWSLLLFFSINPVWTEETAKIVFLSGDIQWTPTLQKKMKIGMDIPMNLIVSIPEKGKLEIEYNKITYSLRGKLKNMPLSDIRLGYFSKSSIPTFALGVRGFKEAWDSLIKDSDIAYENYIQGKIVDDYNGWKIILEKTFLKLVNTSGKEKFTPIFAIIKDDSFNAGAFPSGQFVINTGTLKYLDSKIDILLNTNPDETRDSIREKYIAAILAHELAHFYNKHIFLARKRIITSNEKTVREDKFLIKELKFSQETELDADSSGLLLLQRAGYDPKWMIGLLKILNEKSLEEGDTSPYFSTHPSPHTRLSLIPNDEQELHKWISKMEYVFADIQAGRNLNNALTELENALKKYPENKDFLKAVATCKHKIWLNGLSPRVQKLRSIIDMPSFRDTMIESLQKKSMTHAKGDPQKYKEAIEAYAKVIDRTQEPYFISNLATLLAYSDNGKFLDKAIEFAELAYKTGASVQTLNNLGIVYFITEKKKEEAYKIFTSLAQKMDNSNFNLPQLKSQLVTEQSLKLALDKKYVSSNFTPILNLSLVSFYLGNKDVKAIANQYLNQIDSGSEWAVLLASLTNTELPSETLGDLRFAILEIGIGTSRKYIEQKMKDKNGIEIPIKESVGEETVNATILNYTEIGISFTIISNRVTRISIYKSDFAMNNHLKLGLSSDEVEKILTSKCRKSGDYQIYIGDYNHLALRFESGFVSEIQLFK